MKKVLAIVLVAAWGSLALGASGSLAATHHHAAPRTLVVAMRDPGCHWFLVHGKYSKTATVNGPIRLLDQDEGALKVASRHGTERIPVGKSRVLRRGHYVVMMYGQATDDNYLKLTVR